MNNFKYYHFLSAKVDLENGFKKIKKGEVLDKEDEEALKDIIKIVVDFATNNKDFIEKQ